MPAFRIAAGVLLVAAVFAHGATADDSGCTSEAGESLPAATCLLIDEADVRVQLAEDAFYACEAKLVLNCKTNETAWETAKSEAAAIRADPSAYGSGAYDEGETSEVDEAAAAAAARERMLFCLNDPDDPSCDTTEADAAAEAAAQEARVQTCRADPELPECTCILNPDDASCIPSTGGPYKAAEDTPPWWQEHFNLSAHKFWWAPAVGFVALVLIVTCVCCLCSGPQEYKMIELPFWGGKIARLERVESEFKPVRQRSIGNFAPMHDNGEEGAARPAPPAPEGSQSEAAATYINPAFSPPASTGMPPEDDAEA